MLSPSESRAVEFSVASAVPLLFESAKTVSLLSTIPSPLVSKAPFPLSTIS